MTSSRSRSRGAFAALLAFRRSRGQQDVGQDCAFSGGAYAMANGPDPVKLLEFALRPGPGDRADRPQGAAGLTPSPIWLARCTSMFSAVSEGRNRLVRQFTMPSVRE